MSTEGKVILAIRVRGSVRVGPEIMQTLKALKLGRLHQARIIKLTPSITGMIDHAKDYITWGEIDDETAILLLTKRGRLSQNRRLTDEHVKKNSSHKGVASFAKALVGGSASFTDIEGLKPIFRLTPPVGGYHGKKRLPIKMGGITGYRGPDINLLARKMM